MLQVRSFRDPTDRCASLVTTFSGLVTIVRKKAIASSLCLCLCLCLCILAARFTQNFRQGTLAEIEALKLARKINHHKQVPESRLDHTGGSYVIITSRDRRSIPSSLDAGQVVQDNCILVS